VRRRILVANLALVTIILLVLELPLAVTFARRERDASSSAAQRDAISFAGLAEEVIEHPGEHDPGSLARRYASGTSDTIHIVDQAGQSIAATGPAANSAPSAVQADALNDARSGESVTGHDGGSVFAAATIGSDAGARGAVLISRPDNRTETRIHELWAVLLGTAAIVLAVAAFVGDRLALWATAPLRRLDDRAAELGYGDLSVRADSASGPPEVTQLARTFNDMASRLEELVNNQRQFVADASHQLRSPLTALRLRIEGIDLDDPETAAADIEAAQTETARLSRLVDGLLTLARSERAEVERRVVDVGDVVEARRAAWTPLAEERDVAIVSLDGDDARVLVGDGQLEQMLDNLIDNAIEVSESGARVTLCVARDNGMASVHVIDEGPGMSADDRARAFETFWQGRGDRRTGSAGLGLSIVARLARANGGSARLDAAPGQGLDAAVLLPVEASPSAR
jgi:signal transduction histidine kinase